MQLCPVWKKGPRRSYIIFRLRFVGEPLIFRILRVFEKNQYLFVILQKNFTAKHGKKILKSILFNKNSRWESQLQLKRDEQKGLCEGA